MEAQTTRPAASITLADGKSRTLIFTMAACAVIKREHGVSVMLEGTAKIFQSIDEVKLPKLLALGMDHEFPGGDPGITEQVIAKLLTAQNSLEALKSLDEAFGRSLIKNVLEVIDAFQATQKAKAELETAIKAAKPEPPTPAGNLTPVM